MGNTNRVICLDSVIARHDGIMAVDLDGEIGMMNIDKGKYYGMDAIGSRVWELIEKPSTIKSIVKTLLTEYNVEEKICEQNIIEFTCRLYSEDLIQVV